MRKIVILFAVLMLMTPVLAAETSRVMDMQPLINECFHRGYQYNASYFPMAYNGTMWCAVDFPEKHIWWLFPMHQDVIGIISVTVSNERGEVRNVYLDTGNGLKKVPRPFISHL